MATNPIGLARCFEDLIVWRKAHEFVLMIYKATEQFPRQEIYGLTSQLRRAAVSIPANIAEGFKKRGRPDKVRFLRACLKIQRVSAAGLLAVAGVGAALTARFGDARSTPPWPRPKSLAAGTLSIFRHAFNIAQGSLEECRYYLILARDLNYGETAQLNQQLVEVSKLLEAYSAKILTSGS